MVNITIEITVHIDDARGDSHSQFARTLTRSTQDNPRFWADESKRIADEAVGGVIASIEGAHGSKPGSE